MYWFLFVLFNNLHLSQQNYSHVRTFPGLNQNLAEDKVSCSQGPNSSNTVPPVRLKPVTPQSEVKHSTTKPLPSSHILVRNMQQKCIGTAK